MPPSRSASSQLLRLLEAAAQPIYALDSARRITYLNSACLDWLAAKAEDLLGQTCRYHSADDADLGGPALATMLCPPPDCLAGRRCRGRLTVARADGRLETRQALFVCLPGPSDEPSGLIVFVSPVAADSAADEAGPAEPDAAALHARIRRYRHELGRAWRLDRLLGDSVAMRRVRSQIALAAGAMCHVVVVGPKGSGRQHVARAIHFAAHQAAGALVPLACPLLGAELLQATIRSLVRTARENSGGTTLLLNELDEMSPEAQNELAGFLSLTDLPLRIVATTAAPPAALVAQGKLRADLAFLLSTLVIELPPLVQRLDDLPLLAQLFLEDANAHGDKQLLGFTSDALDQLAAYHWPGQVAELAEVVAQAHAAAEGPEVTARDLPRRLHVAVEAQRRPSRKDEPIVLDQFLARIEEELIRRALRRAKGNKTRAARLLGMTRPRLYRRLVQLGLEPPPERPPHGAGD